MLGKKLLVAAFALFLLASAGCCRMWERWCDRPHYGQPAPYCCPSPPPQQCCPPPSFSSPAATPVPSAPGGNWARPCP